MRRLALVVALATLAQKRDAAPAARAERQRHGRRHGRADDRRAHARADDGAAQLRADDGAPDAPSWAPGSRSAGASGAPRTTWATACAYVVGPSA